LRRKVVREVPKPIAKEWYAYALFRFKGRDEIWEIIKLLEDALQSDFYRAELNWAAGLTPSEFGVRVS